MAKEFSANVIVANEYSLLGTGSVANMINVDATAVAVKAGASKVAGRTTVTVQAHPDNTGYVFLGLSNAVTTTANTFYCLAGGAGIVIKLDTTDNLDVYAIGSASGQKLLVLEGTT